MNRHPMALFVVLVISPAIAFFCYAYFKIGKASISIVSQEKSKVILSNNGRSTLSTQDIPSEISKISDVLSDSQRIVLGGDSDTSITPLTKIEEIHTILKQASGILSDVGYSEGPFLDRIKKAVVLPKNMLEEDQETVSPTTENSEEQLDCWVIWQSGENTYDLFFGLNNDSLTPPVEEALKKLLEENFLSDRKVVHLSGFTDTTGSASLNCKLAKQRLQQVSDFIISNFPEYHISTTAHGENDVPFSPDQDELYEPRNRIVRMDFDPNNLKWYGQECSD